MKLTFGYAESERTKNMPVERRRKVRYDSELPFGHSSLASLLLLSPENPLRWASPGTHMTASVPSQKMEPLAIIFCKACIVDSEMKKLPGTCWFPIT